MAEQQAAQMQSQLNQLMTQVQRLTGELQDSRQRETTLAERLNQVAQQQAQMRVESNLGPLVDAITESQKQVVAASQKDKKLTLIDNRGVAKPERWKQRRRLPTMEDPNGEFYLVSFPRVGRSFNMGRRTRDIHHQGGR